VYDYDECLFLFDVLYRLLQCVHSVAELNVL